MVRIAKPFFKWIGLFPSGDIGGWTVYFCWKKGIRWFLKAPPDKPPTFLQQQARDNWKLILTGWNALPAATKDDWAELVHRAGLRITALNLYIHVYCCERWDYYDSLVRSAGIDPIARMHA